MSKNNTLFDKTSTTSYSLRLTLLLILEVPAIVVSLMIFAHFVSSRTARATRHHHSPFLLLLFNFIQISTDIPMSLDYYRSGGLVRPATNAYCTWWTFYENSLFAIHASLMAWISIERHLLIFHTNLLNGVSSSKGWCLHIAPWIVCLLWGPLFYMITIVSGLVCTNRWNFDAHLCGQLCHFSTVWGSLDVFVNIVVFVTIIFIANITLIIRVVYQRLTIAARTPIKWHKQRKMVFQLVAISVTYLVVWVPAAAIIFVQLYLDQTFLSDLLELFYFLAYIGPLTLPLIYLVSIPHLSRRMKNICWREQRYSFAPVTVVYRARPVSYRRGMAILTSAVLNRYISLR